MKISPNQSDHRFAPGDRVEHGTSGPHGGDRLGEIQREHREYGQDGYLIIPLSGGPGDGTLPSVYPGRMVTPWKPARWAYNAGRNAYERTYTEIRIPGVTVTGNVDVSGVIGGGGNVYSDADPGL